MRRRIFGLASVCALAALPSLILLVAGWSLANKGDCGQPSTAGATPVATDALYVLKTAVGTKTCELCVCDTTGNGTILASDAQLDLRFAVGQPVQLKCEDCLPSTTTTTTTSTTTTTLGGCPLVSALNNLTYNQKYTCIEHTPPGGPYYCIDQNVNDTSKFVHKGGGVYDVLDIPASDYALTGTLICRTFTWSALSPGDYTESGVWTFSSDLKTFTGSSTYVALDGSYAGSCNETGAKSPTSPPNPPTLPPCQ